MRRTWLGHVVIGARWMAEVAIVGVALLWIAFALGLLGGPPVPFWLDYWLVLSGLAGTLGDRVPKVLQKRPTAGGHGMLVMFYVTEPRRRARHDQEGRYR